MREDEDIFILLAAQDNVIMTIRGLILDKKDEAAEAFLAKMEGNVFLDYSVIEIMDKGYKDVGLRRAVYDHLETLIGSQDVVVRQEEIVTKEDFVTYLQGYKEKDGHAFRGQDNDIEGIGTFQAATYGRIMSRDTPKDTRPVGGIAEKKASRDAIRVEITNLPEREP